MGIKKNVAIKTSVKLFSIRTNNIHFPEFEFYNSAKVEIFQECWFSTNGCCFCLPSQCLFSNQVSHGLRCLSSITVLQITRWKSHSKITKKWFTQVCIMINITIFWCDNFLTHQSPDFFLFSIHHPATFIFNFNVSLDFSFPLFKSLFHPVYRYRFKVYYS